MNKIYWLYLSIAILAEVLATSTLKSSKEFTVLYPSIIVVLSYIIAFYFLSLTLRVIPIGIAYAIWAGVGVLLITLVGWLFYKQTLDFAGILGVFLITLGVIVINLFSKTIPH